MLNMKTRLAVSPLNFLAERLQANKHYCEFKMTKEGFTKGDGKYYDPSELTMVNMYSFEEPLHPGEFSFVYILRDNSGVLGYSKDLFSEYSINEENLYHWFIAKIPRELFNH